MSLTMTLFISVIISTHWVTYLMWYFQRLTFYEWQQCRLLWCFNYKLRLKTHEKLKGEDESGSLSVFVIAVCKPQVTSWSKFVLGLNISFFYPFSALSFYPFYWNVTNTEGVKTVQLINKNFKKVGELMCLVDELLKHNNFKKTYLRSKLVWKWRRFDNSSR